MLKTFHVQIHWDRGEKKKRFDILRPLDLHSPKQSPNIWRCSCQEPVLGNKRCRLENLFVEKSICCYKMGRETASLFPLPYLQTKATIASCLFLQSSVLLKHLSRCFDRKICKDPVRPFYSSDKLVHWPFLGLFCPNTVLSFSRRNATRTAAMLAQEKRQETNDLLTSRR